jgi:hypothetical protein
MVQDNTPPSPEDTQKAAEALKLETEQKAMQEISRILESSNCVLYPVISYGPQTEVRIRIEQIKPVED